MSELILAQSKEVLKKMFERLKYFCDHLYFDELQDFMGKDFELLKHFISEPDLDVFAVGDFHQHSVSKSDFTASKPYLKKVRHICLKMNTNSCLKERQRSMR